MQQRINAEPGQCGSEGRPSVEHQMTVVADLESFFRNPPHRKMQMVIIS